MQPPQYDLIDRSPLWESMQFLWMDTDPRIELPQVTRVCAQSKYSLQELEAIFWNEVRPAVGSNLLAGPAPQWSGFKPEELQRRVLAQHGYGRAIRFRSLDPYSRSWWLKLEAEILALRSATPAKDERSQA